MSICRTLLLATATVLILSPAAEAVIVEYDFTGNITAGPAGPPLGSFVQANHPISGYFRFDAGTAPSLPGSWALPTAQFHVLFDTLTFDTVGATAHVGVNQDIITFSASVPQADFPFPISSATLSLGFQTFMNGYFSLTTLPVVVPPNDHMLGLALVSGGVPDGASTDTALFPTVRLIPEPGTLALLGAGIALIGVMTRRRKK